jgi:L-threonylcarbamoyladenylate synthase
MEMSDVVRAGGVVVFPADTVYGLACDPGRDEAVARMYALKGRPPDKPSALMYFDLDDALATVDAPTRALLARLLPGPVTVVLPDGRGLRVPDLPRLVGVPPVLQTSANHTGESDARRLDEVPADIREGADLVIDGGELPGTPSTVVELSGGPGALRIVREGAVPASEIRRRLAVS